MQKFIEGFEKKAAAFAMKAATRGVLKPMKNLFSAPKTMKTNLKSPTVSRVIKGPSSMTI